MVAISPDGKTAYVTDEGSEEVSVIDTATDHDRRHRRRPRRGLRRSPSPRTASSPTSATGEEAVEAIETATGKAVGPNRSTVGEVPRRHRLHPERQHRLRRPTGCRRRRGDQHGARPGRRHDPCSAAEPAGLAVIPDGRRLYVANEQAGTASVDETEGDRTGRQTDRDRRRESKYIAMTPDGKTAYVSAPGEEAVDADRPGDRIVASKPIAFVGEPAGRSWSPPTSRRPPPSPRRAATATVPATFSGAASTDPDGTVASWDWGFGDGVPATRASASPTPTPRPGPTREAQRRRQRRLRRSEVFTGQTAYCSGNAGRDGRPPVTVAPAPAAPSAAGAARQVPLRRPRPQPSERDGAAAGEAAGGRVAPPLRQEGPRGDPQNRRRPGRCC